jgi:hypothetical protein
MVLLTVKKWPDVLRSAPDTANGLPHEVPWKDRMSARNAITRVLKFTNPEMEFETKTRKKPDGTLYLAVWKTTKGS